MKEPYSEGLANYADPESCVTYREVRVEALTGEAAGWVLSRDKILPSDADALEHCGRPHRGGLLWQGPPGSGAVRDPMHARTFSAREPGDLMVGSGGGPSPDREPNGARR